MKQLNLKNPIPLHSFWEYQKAKQVIGQLLERMPLNDADQWKEYLQLLSRIRFFEHSHKIKQQHRCQPH